MEICRALAARARIILMDEPTSSLQRDDVERLFALIRKLKSDGISLIYISHFLEEVREIADRFTVLRDGRSVATGEIAAVTDDQLIAQMVGRPVENLFPTSNGAPRQSAETRPGGARSRCASVAQACQFSASSRRDTGHSRPDGIGSDAAGPRALRSR